MFKLGDIITSTGPKGTDYYIVVEDGTNPKLELVEDYILRCRTVYYEGEYCTLREVLSREKQRIINRGYINV
jgi:hypothetical protein